MDKSGHIVRRKQGLLVGLCVLSTIATWPAGDTVARTRIHHRPAQIERLHPPQILTREPSVSAETACLIDVDTGRILFEKDGNKRMRIASLTKIVTAWVAVRSGKLGDIVTATRNATRQEGSSVYLSVGEKQTLLALCYAIMLRSGNDAAMAIAEHLGNGSSAQFAERMNQDVRQLGLTHSHFVNPHGLDHPEHYSTAHDMAVITAAALHNPTFRRIVSTKTYTIPWPGSTWDRKMKNKNKLLWMVSGADGVKTGYTKLAGRCLASSMTRDGHQVALIVLRDPNDWSDSAHLLTYGLTGFERKNITQLVHHPYTAKVRYGERETVPLVPSGSVIYPLHRDETAAIEARVIKLRALSAPLRKGQAAGTVAYYLHGQLLGQVALVVAEPVAAKGIIGRIREWMFH